MEKFGEIGGGKLKRLCNGCWEYTSGIGCGLNECRWHEPVPIVREKKKPVNPIDEVNEEAKKEGLSYGQFVAKPDRRCETCGAYFKAKHKSTRFCSAWCKKKARRR